MWRCSPLSGPPEYWLRVRRALAAYADETAGQRHQAQITRLIGRLRIDCLESACSYTRSRGNRTAESRKSRSLMDPSSERSNWLRIVLLDSTGNGQPARDAAKHVSRTTDLGSLTAPTDP